MQDFNLVIGRAVFDENFRAQVFNNPHAALQGFNLSPEQVQMLQNVSLDQFNNLVQQFGEELARGDTFMKACATGEHIKKAVLTVRKAGESQPDYYMKWEDPAAAQVDYYNKVSLPYIEQDNLMGKHLPADDQGSPPPPPGNQAVGLVVIAIIAILIGLLIPAAFAPTDTVNGGLEAMGFTFACLPAPESSELPAVQKDNLSANLDLRSNNPDRTFSVPPDCGSCHLSEAGDVNGDGVSNEADVAARKAGGQQQEYLVITLKEVVVTSYHTGGSDQGLNLGGILIGLNDMRLAVGNEGFLPDCGDNTSDPQDGEMTTQGEDGGTTGGTTGGGQPTGGTSTGGDQPTPDDGLCANNGGIQWQGQACVCPGLIDNVTTCADGTKIDQVTDQTCVPDQSCDQPPDPQNPPPSCPCTAVCVQWSTTSVAAGCSKYEWHDCTGAVCTPPTTP